MNTAVKQLEQIEVSHSSQHVKRTVVKRKKKSLYNFTNLAILTGVGAFCLIAGRLYLDAQMTQIHYETEALKLKISNQIVVNEEFYSKIAELSTYSRAMEIAKQNGLSTYNNIVNIGE